MAMRPSLDDLLEEVSREKLRQTCTDEHLCEIAGSITNWRSIAPFLGISEVEEEEIQGTGVTSTQRLAMLRKWREKFGRKATYWRLASVFWRQERADLIGRICELLLDDKSSDEGNPTPEVEVEQGVLEQYADYLQSRYLAEIPPFVLQWPPPPTRKVFNLAMIHTKSIRRGPMDEELVRLTLRGNIDDIMQDKTAVKLEKIFKLDKVPRKVILIEGAPGSGKSTLAWYACQKWSSHEMFQEFHIVVFVQLRDPAVQSATSIADLLPAASNHMRREVLSKLESQYGKGLLFVLDGWDEYSKGLMTGDLLYKLICRPADIKMHRSKLFITSRPVASGKLQQYCSTRIEIVGFAPEQVKEYFTDALDGYSQIVSKFHDCLRQRPVIQASCYLPLNAAIVVHLFLDLNHTLPTTLHGVFTSMVLCSIARHLRKEEEERQIPKMVSFDHIPTEIQPHFNRLCALAFHGIKENKASFSEEDLQAVNFPTQSTTPLLSLIQGMPTFRSTWEDWFYNFLHLSIQELLAAFHISKLPPSTQVQVFRELFGQPRFNAVLQFYAAFSKFQVEGIRQFVRQVLQPSGNIGGDQQSLAQKAILDCLFEAQDPSLCQDIGTVMEGRLRVTHTVSPLDCMVLGYFLHCILCDQNFRIEFHGCNLDEYKFSYFTNELKECSKGELFVHLSDNHYQWPINASSIVSVLQEKCSHFIRLSLDFSSNSLGGIYFIEHLKPNSILKALNLSSCQMPPEIYRKALAALQCLEHLILSYNLHGIRSITPLLKTHSTLKTLNVSRCDLGLQGARELADSLRVNDSLEELILSRNNLSVFSCGLSSAHHIARALRSNSTLRRLDVSHCSLTNHTARAIAEGVVDSSLLQELDLSGCEITDFGLEVICQNLKKSKSLQKLILYLLSEDDELPGIFVSHQARKNFAAEMKTSNIVVNFDYTIITY